MPTGSRWSDRSAVRPCRGRGSPARRCRRPRARRGRATATSDAPAPRSAGAAAVADAIALAATPELVQALRAELAMRAHAEAGLRARAVDAETRLAARLLLSQRTIEALRLVRAELDQLGGLLTDERARRQAAEQRVAELERQLATDRGRSDDAAAEIAALRDSLQQLRAPAEAGPGGPRRRVAGRRHSDRRDRGSGRPAERRADAPAGRHRADRSVARPAGRRPADAGRRTSAVTPVNAAITPIVRRRRSPLRSGRCVAAIRRSPASSRCRCCRCSGSPIRSRSPTTSCSAPATAASR